MDRRQNYLIIHGMKLPVRPVLLLAALVTDQDNKGLPRQNNQ